MKIQAFAFLLLAGLAASAAAAPAGLTATGKVTPEGGKTSDWVAVLQAEPTAVLPRGVKGTPIGADGKFALTAPAAGRRFVCLFHDGKLDADSILPVVLPAKKPEILELKPKSPRAQVAVTLKREDGKAVTQALRVHLYNALGAVDGAGTSVPAAAGGKLSFSNLPAGRYDLWVERPAGAEEFPSRLSRIEITPGADTQNVELVLPRAGAAKGTLFLADGKTPAAGCTVMVQSGTAPEKAGPAGAMAIEYARGARECWTEAVVAKDGSFALEGLTPGIVMLDVRKPGALTAWCTLPPARIRPGETLEVGRQSLATNGWQQLFDGKTLAGWKETDFTGRVPVYIRNRQVFLPTGADMTGITRKGDPPRTNYEISLDAQRYDGSDFFCGLTFPVGKDPCSLICGGWGGTIVGLSSIDGYDASENETNKMYQFDNRRWYRIRLRVTPERIRAWIDDEPIVDFETKDHKISIRWEVEESKPLGIATWETTGALRDIRLRELEGGN